MDVDGSSSSPIRRTVHSNFVKCMTVLLQCQEAHLHPIIPDLAVALLETFHKDQDKQASSSQAPAGGVQGAHVLVVMYGVGFR